MWQPKKIAVAICTIAFSQLLFFVLMEVVVAATHLSTKSNTRFIPGIGGGNVPNAFYRNNKEGFSEGYFNSHGFRDYERSYEKPKDTFRIIVFGDSYVEALGVPLENSFPAILEKKLNQNSHSVKFEVINLGTSGFGTADEYMRYLNIGVKYHPDLVIVAFLTANDFRNNSKFLNLAEPGFYFSFDEGGNLVLDRSVVDGYEKSLTLPRRLFQLAKERSYLANLISERLYLLRWQMKFDSVDTSEEHPQQQANRSATSPVSELLDYNIYRPDMSNHWKEAVALTKAIIIKFKQSVEANGTQFLLVSLSNSEQIDPQRQKDLQAEYGVQFDFDQPDRIIGELAQAEHIPYLQLMPIFREAHLRWGKHLHGFGTGESGHWNESGHRLAAEKIFESLTGNHMVKM